MTRADSWARARAVPRVVVHAVCTDGGEIHALVGMGYVGPLPKWEFASVSGIRACLECGE